MSSRTGGSKLSACWMAWSASRRSLSNIVASSATSSISMRRSPGARASCSLTSWPIRIWLALRRVADRVEAAARALPANRGRVRLAGDRVLVAIGPDEQAEQLVRAGKRIADALDAGWTVVYVETPALLRLSEQERDRRIDLL